MTDHQTVTIYTYERTADYDPRYHDYFCSLNADEPTDGEYERDDGQEYVLPRGIFPTVDIGGCVILVDTFGRQSSVYLDDGCAVCITDSNYVEHVLTPVNDN